MLRTLFTLALAAVLAGAAQAKNVTIRWHGQSFFEVKSSDATLLVIDPHNIEAYGRYEINADAILVSHFHIDHTSPEPIANFRTAKKLYGLKNPKGLEGARRNDEFNELDEKVKDIRVRSIGSYHDKMQGMQRGKNSIFILEVDGLRVVHLGDLGHTLTPAQVKAIGDVDVLMIPVGGVYTINGADAKKVVEQLKPTRYVIPMHYATRVYDYVLDEKEFLEEQEEKYVKRFKENELVIDTESARREKPVIAILSYEQKEK